MKKLKFLALAVAVVVLAAFLCGCGSGNGLKIGTGGTGGTYYKYGNALVEILQEDGTDASVKTTAGSAANLRLLSESYLQIAIVQSDTLLDSVAGTNAFAKDARTGYSAVAALYTESCQIVVAKDSDIKTVADLEGKRVSVGEEDSGVYQNAEQILNANGISMKKIKDYNLSFTDSAEALKNGEIDAFFITGGAPTSAVTTLAQEMDIRLLSIDDSVIKQLKGLYPCYVECTIPAGTYKGQDKDVKTLGVKAILVVNDSMTDVQVKHLTSMLFDKSSDIQYAVGTEEAIDLKSATEGVPIGFHSGAVKYYEEQGITVEAGGSNIQTGFVTGSQDD